MRDAREQHEHVLDQILRSVVVTQQAPREGAERQVVCVVSGRHCIDLTTANAVEQPIFLRHELVERKRLHGPSSVFRIPGAPFKAPVEFQESQALAEGYEHALGRGPWTADT
jgi:hypothetical protein